MVTNPSFAVMLLMTVLFVTVVNAASFLMGYINNRAIDRESARKAHFRAPCEMQVGNKK